MLILMIPLLLLYLLHRLPAVHGLSPTYPQAAYTLPPSFTPPAVYTPNTNNVDDNCSYNDINNPMSAYLPVSLMQPYQQVPPTGLGQPTVLGSQQPLLAPLINQPLSFQRTQQQPLIQSPTSSTFPFSASTYLQSRQQTPFLRPAIQQIQTQPRNAASYFSNQGQQRPYNRQTSWAEKVRCNSQQKQPTQQQSTSQAIQDLAQKHQDLKRHFQQYKSYMQYLYNQNIASLQTIQQAGQIAAIAIDNFPKSGLSSRNLKKLVKAFKTCALINTQPSPVGIAKKIVDKLARKCIVSVPPSLITNQSISAYAEQLVRLAIAQVMPTNIPASFAYPLNTNYLNPSQMAQISELVNRLRARIASTNKYPTLYGTTAPRASSLKPRLLMSPGVTAQNQNKIMSKIQGLKKAQKALAKKLKAQANTRSLQLATACMPKSSLVLPAATIADFKKTLENQLQTKLATEKQLQAISKGILQKMTLNKRDYDNFLINKQTYEARQLPLNIQLQQTKKLLKNLKTSISPKIVGQLKTSLQNQIKAVKSSSPKTSQSIAKASGRLNSLAKNIKNRLNKLENDVKKGALPESTYKSLKTGLQMHLKKVGKLKANLSPTSKSGKMLQKLSTTNDKISAQLKNLKLAAKKGGVTVKSLPPAGGNNLTLAQCAALLKNQGKKTKIKN